MTACTSLAMYFHALQVGCYCFTLSKIFIICACSIFFLDSRVELARNVASLIGVIKTKAEFYLNEYKPTIKLDEKYCVAGRITLPRTGSFLTENYV